MKDIQYFKSKKHTHRFRKNQKVWIRYANANHLELFFKFKGKGRWIKGICDKFALWVGEIKTISVEDKFANFILGEKH
ncbi:MAG: hypothetical protein DRJ07_03380 [Bacteroidetes bacterium]|nr:MAG: hypothetical protein DRJ07_03380 [Bacteroidota bacterium]